MSGPYPAGGRNRAADPTFARRRAAALPSPSDMRVPTLSPSAYRRVTLFALLALTFIVVTGGAVRLTGSGLGCPDWPTCAENRVVAPLGVPRHGRVREPDDHRPGVGGRHAGRARARWSAGPAGKDLTLAVARAGRRGDRPDRAGRPHRAVRAQARLRDGPLPALDGAASPTPSCSTTGPGDRTGRPGRRSGPTSWPSAGSRWPPPPWPSSWARSSRRPARTAATRTPSGCRFLLPDVARLHGIAVMLFLGLTLVTLWRLRRAGVDAVDPAPQRGAAGRPRRPGRARATCSTSPACPPCSWASTSPAPPPCGSPCSASTWPSRCRRRGRRGGRRQ